MKNLIQALQATESSRFDTILFVGAGRGESLPALRRLGAERIVLSEPNPGNLHVLGRMIDLTRNEEILQIAAASTNSDYIDLHVLNSARYSSTATPKKVIELRPNLKIERTLSVPARGLTQVVENLSLAADKTNLLIMNSQGCNHALLQSLPINQLYGFEWLLISGMQIQEAYEDDKSIADTTFYLRENGFETIMHDPEAIHPNTSVLLRRNPLVHRVLAFEKQNRELVNALEATNNLSAERQTQLQQVSQERDGKAQQLAESQAQLARLQQARSEQDEHAKALQAQIESLTQSRDEHARLAGERASQLESLTQAKAAADKLAAERQTQLQQVSQERDGKVQQLAESQAQLARLQQARSEQDQHAKALQAQIESLTRSRDEHAQKVEQQSLRISQLESERRESDARQQLINEEMIRAEAQIDLIKDVLLREPGL